MKKPLKKMLSVILSALMLMSCFGAAAPIGFAQECEHNFAYSSTVAPTCTEEGYDIRICSLCNEVEHYNQVPENGHTWVFSYSVPATCGAQGYDIYECSVCHVTENRNIVAPTGSHVNYYYDTVAPTCTTRGYDRLRCSVCARIIADPNSYVEELPHTYDIEYDLYDVENEYYRQIKTCTVCSKVEEDDEYYMVELVKLVKVNGVLEQTSVKTAYAKKNGITLYDGTPTLTVGENDDFAQWRFVGWVEDVSDTPVALDTITIIEPDTTLIAVFEGVDVYFDVTFYDYAGRQFGSPQRILYKHGATAPTNVTQTYNNNHCVYTFEGWDKEFNSVTSNLHINPVYSSAPEQVSILFYGPDDNGIVKEWTGDYGTQINLIAPPKEQIVRAADSTYVYEFTGNWANAGGIVQTVANKSLSLYPVFAKQTIKYDVSLRIYYDGLGASGASYQVLASNGNLAAAGFVDEAGRSVGLALPNGTYTVKCASASKLQAGEKTFVVNTGGLTVVDVTLVDNDQYYDDGTKNCACICHSVISGIWIRILNILYTLFNIRYVCCNDMFATHGDQLKYTA